MEIIEIGFWIIIGVMLIGTFADLIYNIHKKR